MEIPESKVCSVCGQDKPLQAFNRFKHGKFGREARCKSCSHNYNLSRPNRRVDPPTHKTCPKCGETKPTDEFGMDKYASDGKATRCILCKRQEAVDSRIQNPEAHRAKVAKWKATHPNQVHAYDEAYKPRKKHRRHERYLENREEVLAQNAAWYAAHKEERKESMTAWEDENRAKRKAQKAEYYLDNREAILVRNAAWYAANPGAAIVKWERRTSQQAGAEKVDLSPEQWEEIKAAKDYRCDYCPDDCLACINKTHDLHQDHITPVSQGGDYSVHNIVPCCRVCNSRKGSGPPLKPVQPLLLTIARPHTPKKRQTSS